MVKGWKYSAYVKSKFFAYWEIFHAFLSSADFFKINFFESSFRNTIRVSNSLASDQARHFVGPDLGPNHFLNLSADGNSRYRVYLSIISVGPATDGRVESSTPDQATDTTPTAVTGVTERQRNDNARGERTLCLRPPTAVDEC